MTILRQHKGQRAEAAAVKLLQQKGMRIVSCNYRCPLGEIDIIAKDGDTLVFVEVRSRCGTNYGLPQETIGYKKMNKIRSVAKHYIMMNKPQSDYRFDVVAVLLTNGAVVKSIEYIKNAF